MGQCKARGCCSIQRRSVTVVPVTEVTVKSNVLETTKMMLLKRRNVTNVLPSVNVNVRVNSEQSIDAPTDSGEADINT